MQEVFDFANEKMEKSLTALHNEFATMRAGRASASLLDKVSVDYYGVPTPVQQMAAVSVSEGRILVIQPWDVSTISTIEKAIQASDLGVNPQDDGKVIIDKLKKMKKDSEITEDDLHNGEEKMQKITDKFIKRIEEMVEEKEQDIMAI